jgi:hypothetical protein
MDYDEERIYYSYQNLHSSNQTGDEGPPTAVNDDLDGDDVNLDAVKRHFKEFLREFIICDSFFFVVVVVYLFIFVTLTYHSHWFTLIQSNRKLPSKTTLSLQRPTLTNVSTYIW